MAPLWNSSRAAVPSSEVISGEQPALGTARSWLNARTRAETLSISPTRKRHWSMAWLPMPCKPPECGQAEHQTLSGGSDGSWPAICR